MEFNRDFRRVILKRDENGIIIPEKNTIQFESQTYGLKPLRDNFLISKGGNSAVYILYDVNNIEIDKIIKISNYYRPNKNSEDSIKRRYGRFITEIDALNKSKDEFPLSNIVNIFFDSVLEINGKEFPFYVMEKADTDLKEYLLLNYSEIDIQEKVNLCVQIFNGIKQLHELGFYHRDLKPDNILLFQQNDDDEEGTSNFTWKVGDLGLINQREKDYDDVGEKIGPIGWLSPEAMNKYLTEKSNIGFDCKIDEMSDFFQLGKLFWFIFQQNVPIGQIVIADFKMEFRDKKFLFDIIFNLLSYSKDNRISKRDLNENLELLKMEYGL